MNSVQIWRCATRNCGAERVWGNAEVVDGDKVAYLRCAKECRLGHTKHEFVRHDWRDWEGKVVKVQ